MRRLLDSLAGLLVTALVVYLLMQMIKPYVVYILIAAGVYLVGMRVYRHFNNW